MTEKTLPPPVMLVVSWQQMGSLLALLATLGLGQMGLVVQQVESVRKDVRANATAIHATNDRIDTTNDRIDTTNDRIDATNLRIDRLLELVQ